MTKITFVNGTTPAVNATNLNQMQTNIENAIISSNNMLNYTTTEQIIGKWTNGSNLYRKVISFGTLPNNTTKSVAHNIQNLKRIVKLEGFAGSNQNLGGITLPHATSSPVALYADDAKVTVLTTNDKTAYTETYIYVYYTKN